MPNATFNDTVLIRGFVSEPDGRGTFSIIWSCLAVLLLNTWTVLHLNIPPANSSKWRTFLHKSKWWVFCTFVPDGVAVGAYNQWRCARKSVSDMKKRLPWWTVAHGFYAEMGGFRVYEDTTGTWYNFRAAQLSWLAQENLITIPTVSAEDIYDRSTAGALGKSIACAQSAWFLFQTIARVAQHLPISTLELATLPFIGCTWLSYWFWWAKPMDMETFTTIHVNQLPPEQLCRLAKATCYCGETSDWYRPSVKEAHPYQWDYFFWEKPMNIKTFTIEKVSHLLVDEVYCLVMNTSAQAKASDWHREAINETHSADWEHVDFLVLLIIGTLFNGLHLAAWDFQFPSPTEALMWKIAVFAMLGAEFLWIPIAFAFRCFPQHSIAKNIPYYILSVTYITARFYLITEAFAGLRTLPQKAFATVNWTGYFPHIH